MRLSTGKQYKSYIKRLLKFMNDKGYIQEFNNTLSEKERSKNICKYAIKELYKTYNERCDLKSKYRIKSTAKEGFTKQEGLVFLDFVKKSGEELSLRDYGIFKVILETGITMGELVGRNGLPGINDFKYLFSQGDIFLQYKKKGGVIYTRKISKDVYSLLQDGVLNRIEYYNGAMIKTMSATNIWLRFNHYYKNAIKSNLLIKKNKGGTSLLVNCQIDRYGINPEELARA